MTNRKHHRTLALTAILAATTTATVASAQLDGKDMPGTDGAIPGGPDAVQVEEPVIEISVSSQHMPVLVVAPATVADNQLAEEVAAELQLTGLFNVKTSMSLKMSPGLPERAKWPALTTAAVVVSKSTRSGTFPLVTSDSHHAADADVYRRRELVEYPGSEAMTVPVISDAILADVLGVRGHMSGKLVMTDASTRGERSVRVMSPNGKRGRRVSGFGGLARGADMDHESKTWYATEDASGKLQLFKEGQSQPVQLGMPGYVQSVSFAPAGKHIVLSMGEGTRVRTWLGATADSVQMLPLPDDKTALSPSVDDQGRVVHVVGPMKGPFSVFVDSKQVTPNGVWAAMPEFCSTLIEDRVVYMVRSGRSWHVRITSLTNGSTRTVATNAMSPACSPDGRTVAFFSPGKYGKGPGIYLAADMGGMARKVWDGQAAGIRWRGGEKLPRQTIVRLTPEPPPEPEQPEEEPLEEVPAAEGQPSGDAAEPSSAELPPAATVDVVLD